MAPSGGRHLKKKNKFSSSKKAIKQSDKEFLRQLRQAGQMLDEAIRILSFEPANTVEGSRCQTAQEFRGQLDTLIQSLENKIRAAELRLANPQVKNQDRVPMPEKIFNQS